MISAPYCGASSKPIQARLMKAEPSKEMNRRSPRIVSIPSTPTLGVLGYFMCNNPMPISIAPIDRKNMAVGSVQAIHSIKMSLPCCAYLNPAKGETLGDVIADKIDHNRTRYDCQNACRGKHTPIKTGCRNSPGHDRGNRFCIHTGQRAAQQ